MTMSHGAMWVAVVLTGFGFVHAHPVNLECNDPRFDEGNVVMHVPSQSNQRESAISFTIDRREYKHGDVVSIVVEANGPKYMNEPYGVYLALRALPKYGYASDYGSFGDLTGGLNHTKYKQTGGDCPNTVFSATAFTGRATLTWTAGPQTYDDVTLTLLWGNGVGPDDPLSPKFPDISHAYLYRRTVTLHGPPIPSFPPSTALAPEKCIAPDDGSYNHPSSPVFVQTLRTFPAKSLTFPAGRCLPCRVDQLQRCRSARVDCPAEPGALATERLFIAEDCSGPAVESKLPTAFVHCPGSEYHGVHTLELERFVKKLQRDHASYFPDEATVRAAIAEYRRMLHLIQKFPDAPAVPSKLVDLVWHEHILDTQRYKEDSQRLFGRYIHHNPTFGHDADAVTRAEKEGMLKDQAEMFANYVGLFEDEPPREVWPTATRLGTNRLPDCCKALCVKPNCASCAGCNAVQCGKLEQQPAAQKTHVLPDHVAGYVPAPRELSQRLGASERTYLCDATMMPGMTLSWTISGDSIYMKQALEKKETWYSVGFTDVEPYDMSYADFIVTLFNNNYTGVRDLYKFDAGNNYPCWDVLTECSLNRTAGTMDLKDRTTQRQSGVSSSTWTRKLITGDYKDSPITRGKKKVLVAYGVEDSFTYHGKAQARSCDVDFYGGAVECGETVQSTVASYV